MSQAPPACNHREVQQEFGPPTQSVVTASLVAVRGCSPTTGCVGAVEFGHLAYGSSDWGFVEGSMSRQDGSE